jgi:hypothetical protein
MRMPMLAYLLVAALPFTLAACGDDDDDGGDDDVGIEADAAPTGADAMLPPSGEDLDMKAEDFECVLRWDKVRNFRITNKLGHLDEALAVANDPQGGGAYPVGTVIQIVPQEAMVKRAAGWNAESADWEFFALGVSASGTTIDMRGTTPSNAAGSCKGCHAKAETAYDFVCETDHGCDPLPIGSDILVQIQNGDARCP